MAADEATGPVPATVRTRQHRLAVQVAVQVVDQRIDGPVARLRLPAQRLGQDRVQVAAQLPLGGPGRHAGAR